MLSRLILLLFGLPRSVCSVMADSVTPHSHLANFADRAVATVAGLFYPVGLLPRMIQYKNVCIVSLHIAPRCDNARQEARDPVDTSHPRDVLLTCRIII